MSKEVELIEIGGKVNASIKAVWAVGLTIKEMDKLEAYVNHQETIAPLLHPSLIQKHGFKMFDQAKRRIELLRPILKLKELEAAGK